MNMATLCCIHVSSEMIVIDHNLYFFDNQYDLILVLCISVIDLYYHIYILLI